MYLARNLKVESVSRLHPTPPWQVTPAQTIADGDLQSIIGWILDRLQ